MKSIYWLGSNVLILMGKFNYINTQVPMCTLGHNIKHFLLYVCVYHGCSEKIWKTNTVSVDNAEVIGQPGECQCLEVREMKKKKGKQH